MGFFSDLANSKWLNTRTYNQEKQKADQEKAARMAIEFREKETREALKKINDSDPMQKLLSLWAIKTEKIDNFSLDPFWDKYISNSSILKKDNVEILISEARRAAISSLDDLPEEIKSYIISKHSVELGVE